jgi:hypothetical protein
MSEQKKYKYRFYETGYYGVAGEVEVNEPSKELAIAVFEERFPNTPWRFVEQDTDAEVSVHDLKAALKEINSLVGAEKKLTERLGL